jgi:uncharacterized protein YjgD (DUF1641 family)
MIPTTVAPLPATAALDEIQGKLDGLAQAVGALVERTETLTAQVEWLAERSLEQQRRQREWDELRADLMPVVREVYAVTVEEMQAIQHDVALDDVILLLKRLARNTRNLNQLLDWLESVMDLTHDANRMGREMMTMATDSLQEMEQKGYFGFVRQGRYVLDQIVTSFSEEDVRLLGDNIVLILNTVKALTQPEMMAMINNLTQGFHEAEAAVTPHDTGLLALARQARDPDVRRGMAITLATLKRIAAQSH